MANVGSRQGGLIEAPLIRKSLKPHGLETPEIGHAQAVRVVSRSSSRRFHLTVMQGYALFWDRLRGHTMQVSCQEIAITKR